MTALTYVAAHADLRAVKVGYTSAASNRLEGLARHGWKTHRSLTLVTGQLARQIEQATLFELRFRLHVPTYLTKEQLPQDGWTETSSIGLISPGAVWDIVCEQAVLIQLNAAADRAWWLRRPPTHRRTKGDTPKYVAAARKQASLEQTIRKATDNPDERTIR
ncbi:hypothetical protein [Streptomyces virginiae]|uniref:hypothetical protein n=1 Tax=Streptomyces virginiae TaxID=1961 RepID=UPI002253AF33|nr:hypothetical protein [Streptomyces virginiae]MCX5176736.1 hypothetical protein [Streptomyces virginiae]